jgi:hypothetical protein
MMRVSGLVAGIVAGGALALGAATPAAAQSAAACSQIQSTLSSIQTELPQAATNRSVVSSPSSRASLPALPQA